VGQIGRFLDEHMFAGLESLTGEIEMELRRDRDDDRIDGRISQGLAVAGVAGDAAELAAEGLGFVTRAARVAGDDLAPQTSEMTAVDTRNESAAQESDPQGTQWGFSLLNRDSGFGIRWCPAFAPMPVHRSEVPVEPALVPARSVSRNRSTALVKVVRVD